MSRSTASRATRRGRWSRQGTDRRAKPRSNCPCRNTRSTPLRLTQTLRIGRGLTQSLTTRNTGAAPVAFTQALHTYFRVGDAQRVQVSGLENLTYADKYDGREHSQSGAWDLHDPRDPGRSDRIYHRAGGRYVLHDPVLRRRIDLATSGSRSLVVWNPGEQGIAAISDAPAEGWRHFVCLEAANAGEDVIELAPGEIAYVAANHRRVAFVGATRVASFSFQSRLTSLLRHPLTKEEGRIAAAFPDSPSTSELNHSRRAGSCRPSGPGGSPRPCHPRVRPRPSTRRHRSRHRGPWNSPARSAWP